MYPIHAYGSPAQKDKWLPKLQSGKAIGCFGINRAAIRFKSRRHVDARRSPRRSLRFERRKNVDHKWLHRRCRAHLGEMRRRKDSRLPGGKRGRRDLKAWDVHGKFLSAPPITSGLSMTDCEIPEENVLPGVDGLRGPLSCLTSARYGIGWGAIGAAMACYDTALQYTKTRKQFANKPIASHQFVQDKLVFMITEISKAQFSRCTLDAEKIPAKWTSRTSPC